MVDNLDLAEFSVLLDSVSSMLSRGQYRPNDMSTMIFFRALSEFPIELVRSGFDEHVKVSRFVPTPADIRDHITKAGEDDGRPGEEVAFTMALAGRDEADSVVWTEEVGAAFAVCRVHLAEGNTIAARMAFKEVYTKAIDDARKARKPAKWVVSEGHDPTRRAEAVKAAKAAGLLIDVDPDLLTLPAPKKNAALSLPAPAPGDSEAARNGKAALLALAERMKAAAQMDVPASADAVAKRVTAERQREAAQKLEAREMNHQLQESFA